MSRTLAGFRVIRVHPRYPRFNNHNVGLAL